MSNIFSRIMLTLAGKADPKPCPMCEALLTDGLVKAFDAVEDLCLPHKQSLGFGE